MRNARLLLLVLGAAAACAAVAADDPDALYRPQVDVEADPPVYYSPQLFRERDAPKAREFLFIFGKHPLTFEQYVASKPPRPTRSRHTLYLCIVGPADGEMQRVLKMGAPFLEAYYALPVKMLPPVPLKNVATHHFKEEGYDDVRYNANEVIERVLTPIVPKDALMLLGCIRPHLYYETSGVYSGIQMQAYPGVGVVAIGWLLDSPARVAPGHRRDAIVLKRCFHNLTATTAWTLGSSHCDKYYCGMNLGYGPEELDALPLQMCPECLKKMRWNLGIDPAAHCEAIGRMCARAGLNDDAAWYAQRLAQLRQAEREAKAAKKPAPAKPAPEAPRPAPPATADPTP